MASRFRLLPIVAALPLLLWLALPMVSHGASTSTLKNRIAHKQAEIQRHKGRERVLTTDIEAFSHRIGALEGDIGVLQRRQVHLQADLDAKRAELERIQVQLRAERIRLAKLRARLDEARKELAARLVELYKSDRPDIVTVVLNAHGFQDLLESADFMKRISDQDARILDRVRTAKAQSEAAAKRLAGLEQRAQDVANSIRQRRDQVIQVKGDLVVKRNRYQRARAQKAHALSITRDQRHRLEDDVSHLQSRVQRLLQAAAARSAAAPATGVAGPIRQGSGGLIWPVNGPITSPFCESRAWEACHPGIDIGVPEGTPIRAAAAGRVVLMQPEAASGGYGNYTCIQHTASMSTCYAHQSRFATSVGASVRQGQIIGYTGCTGRCYGPHLHFEVRINGSVVNPMNYL